MKKWWKKLQSKCSLVQVMNVCALAVLITSMNATCFWAHHQPEVPEEAKRFRKF